MQDSNSFIALLSTITSHPIGKAVVAILIWLLSFAYAAGSLRTEMKVFGERLDRIEAKVDAILLRTP